MVDAQDEGLCRSDTTADPRTSQRELTSQIEISIQVYIVEEKNYLLDIAVPKESPSYVKSVYRFS